MDLGRLSAAGGSSGAYAYRCSSRYEDVRSFANQIAKRRWQLGEQEVSTGASRLQDNAYGCVRLNFDAYTDNQHLRREECVA